MKFVGSYYYLFKRWLGCFQSIGFVQLSLLKILLWLSWNYLYLESSIHSIHWSTASSNIWISKSSSFNLILMRTNLGLLIDWLLMSCNLKGTVSSLWFWKCCTKGDWFGCNFHINSDTSPLTSKYSEWKVRKTAKENWHLEQSQLNHKTPLSKFWPSKSL